MTIAATMHADAISTPAVAEVAWAALPTASWMEETVLSALSFDDAAPAAWVTTVRVSGGALPRLALERDDARVDPVRLDRGVPPRRSCVSGRTSGQGPSLRHPQKQCTMEEEFALEVPSVEMITLVRVLVSFLQFKKKNEKARCMLFSK
jgi:hypothetical protein